MFRRLFVASFLLIFTATAASAYTIVMRNGRQVEIPNTFTPTNRFGFNNFGFKGQLPVFRGRLRFTPRPTPVGGGGMRGGGGTVRGGGFRGGRR